MYIEDYENELLKNALIILSTSNFLYKGNIVNGTELTKEKIEELLLNFNIEFKDGNCEKRYIKGEEKYIKNFDNDIKILKEKNNDLKNVIETYVNNLNLVIKEKDLLIEQNLRYEKKIIELDSIKNAMKIFTNELKKDKSGGSYYHSWQSNLKMKIYDNSNLDIDKCNYIAEDFLDYLIQQSED